MASPRCSECHDNGILLDREAGTWDVCRCEEGEKVAAAIREGEEDIKAGRLHKWRDVRRNL